MSKLHKQLEQAQLDLTRTQGLLVERDKELQLFKIKLKEFSQGASAVSTDERKFVEVETLLASQQTGNIFLRLKDASDRISQRRKFPLIDQSELQRLII